VSLRLPKSLLLGASLLAATACPACHACHASGARSPEALRDAYAQALRRDDPAAAYDLLSPQLQAATTRVAFAARWKAQRREREAALAAIKSLPPTHRAAILGGQTVHGDRVLAWVRVADHYQIVHGLPGLPDSSTPAQAIRAFLVTVRSADLHTLEALVSDDLTARLRDDWNRRATIIEALLGQPGAIEYSTDMQRAVLRYEPGRALTLEQSPAGWRLTALQ